MKLPARQLMAKAIFAVAVVATTATVGVVGFAQAARPAAESGYGGGIDQLIAAVNEFRSSVLNATTQYRQDVNVCLGGSATMPLGAESRPADSADPQADEAKRKFNDRLDKTVGTLNERVGDSRSAQESPGAFEQTYSKATNEVFTQIDGAKNELSNELGATSTGKAHKGELFTCLDQARDKYQHTLDVAKAKLLEAIRRILG